MSESSSSQLQRSDRTRTLFMFVRRDDGCYMIYKLHPHVFVPSESVSLEISPLVVFKKDGLPSCVCSFAYINPYIYIVGAGKEDVFTIDKNLLISLKSSEKRRGWSEFVNRTNAMTADKNGSLAFAYRDDLYVISAYTCPVLPPNPENNHEFEVYSPITKMWRSLGNSPLSRCFQSVYVHSHLIIANVVYFTTSLHVVMSFDLEAETWITVFDPYGVLAVTSHYVPHIPSFKSQPIILGNIIFGLFERKHSDCDDICASLSLDPCHDFFLRPNLAPDHQFLENSLSVPPEFITDSSDWSQFIFAWDEKTLCVVSYGRDMMTHAYELNNYAQLSFFKISGDYYQCPITSSDGREFYYARNGDQMSYFKAQFCGNSQLYIKTKKQFTHGTPCSCIFVDN